ncbi:MAG: glycosyltransferase, partial [Armatimonadetes bacterium]|nr:glycosyltransferase [Armatimonadota bacterium]
MKVLILLTNDLRIDSRVKRIAKTLSLSNCEVIVLAKRSEFEADFQKIDGYTVKRIIGPVFKKKKKKSDKLEKTWFLKPFFTLKKKLDQYKLKINSSGIKFEKIRPFDYENLYKINEIEEETFIQEVNEQNKIFKEEGLKLNPDLVYCNDLDTLIAGVEIKNKINSKLIYDAHEIFNEQFTNKSKKWKGYFYNLEKSLINFADEIITVNESIGKELMKRYKIKAYTVLANCVNYEQYKKIEHKKIKQILYHGRFEANRGIEELIIAMRYINNARLILRGEGLIKEKLKKIIKDYKLNQKVFFKDLVKSDLVVKEASKFDLGVIAYTPNCLNNYLCSPNKMFEYIMAGLCVCSSDLPELRNYIVNNQIGEVFDPYKPKDIAEKLNKVLNNEDILNKYKNNARKLAMEKLNWEI